MFAVALWQRGVTSLGFQSTFTTRRILPLADASVYFTACGKHAGTTIIPVGEGQEVERYRTVLFCFSINIQQPVPVGYRHSALGFTVNVKPKYGNNLDF